MSLLLTQDKIELRQDLYLINLNAESYSLHKAHSYQPN